MVDRADRVAFTSNFLRARARARKRAGVTLSAVSVATLKRMGPTARSAAPSPAGPADTARRLPVGNA